MADLTQQELNEPNRVKVAKCKTCKGNFLLVSIDILDSKHQKQFESYKSKYNSEIAYISIAEARKQPLCFNPKNCTKSTPELNFTE